jgi:hypothetical protein
VGGGGGGGRGGGCGVLGAGCGVQGAGCARPPPWTATPPHPTAHGTTGLLLIQKNKRREGKRSRRATPRDPPVSTKGWEAAKGSCSHNPPPHTKHEAARNRWPRCPQHPPVKQGTPRTSQERLGQDGSVSSDAHDGEDHENGLGEHCWHEEGDRRTGRYGQHWIFLVGESAHKSTGFSLLKKALTIISGSRGTPFPISRPLGGFRKAA